MKLYLLCDMEGISGITSIGHVYSRDDGTRKWRYPEARRFMTLEVAAAVDAALEAGAVELVVADTHGGGDNLFLDDLPRDPRVRYETPSVGFMMPSLDETFDGLVLLGHHAKAGTLEAFLDHTMDSFSIFDVTLNGVSVGEIALEACYAGHWDVPLLMVQGDEAACREALDQFPGIVTAAVKRAVGRNFSSGPPPEAGRQLTRAAIAKAVQLARTNRPAPFKLSLPLTVRRTYYRTDMADAAAAPPEVRRVDARTVERTVERQCDVWRW